MNFVKKIKNNKGVSLADVAAAIVIMTLLAGTIGNMFYQVYYNVSKVRLNAIAINNAVKILEDTDKLAYEEVDNNMLENNDYNLPENVQASINVEKYSDINPDKKDIIKIITLTINYTLGEETEEITFKKLKIKEI